MSEELKVVLRRSEQHSGFGFSLLGTTGPPHVIYDIVENSPAADCGAVSKTYVCAVPCIHAPPLLAVRSFVCVSFHSRLGQDPPTHPPVTPAHL